MRAEGSRLAEKAEAVTSLLNRAADVRDSLCVGSPFPILRAPDPHHARTLQPRTGAESFERYGHRDMTAKRPLKRSMERIDDLLIHIAEKLDRQMKRRCLNPGDARVSLHLRLNSTPQ